jgi:hypothetical protein
LTLLLEERRAFERDRCQPVEAARHGPPSEGAADEGPTMPRSPRTIVGQFEDRPLATEPARWLTPTGDSFFAIPLPRPDIFEVAGVFDWKDGATKLAPMTP